MCPIWSRENPEFLPSLVCFADILGFSDLTTEALRTGRGKQFLAHLTDSLDRAYRHLKKDSSETGSFDMTVLTDNVVVAFPLADLAHDAGEVELGMMLQVFAELQCVLALDGFFVRGAITFGQHYMDENTAVQDVRGRFFEVVGERRYWLPLAIVEDAHAADGRLLQPVPDQVILSIGRNSLGEFQVPDTRAA